MKSAKIIPFRKPKLETDPTTDSMLRVNAIWYALWVTGVVLVCAAFVPKIRYSETANTNEEE
jgi:hypothetical protein